MALSFGLLFKVVKSKSVIYLLTVNYYSTELIRRLLSSIVVTEQDYQLIIVNNSPEDTSVNQLPQIYSSVTVLTARTNLGFGSGCNLGIQHIYNLNSQAIIWLINPDTQIEKRAIQYIKQCLIQNPNVAILGTKIKDLEGTIWFSAGRFNPCTGFVKDKAKGEVISDSVVQVLNCRWVSGCSLILNLKQFAHCPSFDTQFFLYYEDADLCERCYKQGYQIAVTQAVLVTHAVSSITSKDLSTQFKHATYSKLYFLWKHGTVFALILNLFYMLVLGILLFSKNRPAARGRWQGLKQFILCQLRKTIRMSSTP